MEARQGIAWRPLRLRPLGRLFVGGTEGNRRLTATTAAVLLVLLAAEGATLLALSGVPKAEAVAFAVAAQALVVVTGAAVILLIAAWHVALRVRPHFVRAVAL